VALSTIAGMALGLTGIVAASPPVLADQSANLKYHCTYPLLGTSELDATVTTNIPSTIAPNTFTGPIKITAAATVGADTTEGLALLGVKSLVGTSKASAKVVSADSPIGITQALTFSPATIPVPDSGPFTVNASGTYTGSGNGIQFTNTGWVHVYAGTLLLSITPQDANGQPTALGTFNVTCKLIAGQKNVIGKGLVTSGGTAPTDNLSEYYYDATAGFTPANDTLLGDYAANPLKLDNGYTCQFPYIGNDSLGVHITSDIPATIPAGSAIPRIKFSASADITANTNENGLQTLIPIDGNKVTAITGTAYADSQVNSNDVVDSGGAVKPVPVKLSMPVNFTNVPSSGGFTVTGINGSAPSLAFLKTGAGKVDVGNLTMNLTLHFDSPTQPTQDLGNVPCWKNTGTQGGAELWTTLGGFNVVNGPSQVTGLTATSTDGTNVNLSWTAATPSTGATITGYDVFKDGTKVKTVTGTSTTVSGASSYYAVRAVDSAKLDGPGSAEAAYIPSGSTSNPTPLATPAGLASAAQTETTIDLTWSDVPNAASYDVYRNDALVGNTTTASYSDKGLTAATTYHYQVVAKAPSGSTTYSDSAKSAVFDQATKAPAGPTRLAKPSVSVDDAASATPTLSWGAVAHASGYDVKESTDGGSSYSTVKSLTGTSWKVDPALTAGGHYKFVVVATSTDIANYSASDPSDAVSVDPTPVSNPTQLAKPSVSVDDAASATPTLSWSAVAHATGYDVKESTDGGSSYSTVKSLSGTSWKVDPALTAGGHYKFVVVATSADTANYTASDPSDAVSVDPTPVSNPTQLAKPSVSVDDAASATPTLSWGAVAHASGYDVRESTDGGSSYSTVKSLSGTSWKVDPALSAGGHYKFVVVATSADTANYTASDPSDAVSVDPTPVTVYNPPNPPTTVGSTLDGSKTGITVTWSGAAQGGSPSRAIGGFNIYDKSGNLVKKVTDPTASSYDVTGLASGDYQYSVSSFDSAGLESITKTSGPVVGVPTASGSYSYTLSGSSTLKQLGAKVPLNGAITGPAPDASGAFSADLTLNPATTSFSLFGFIPTTASVTFAPQGKTTGKLSSGVLTTDTKTLVKLPSIKVFGMEISGSSCGTSTATDVALKSTNFTFEKGGTLTGSYTLPALSGCGVLNPVISALAAGPGNTVSLTVTRKS
jgi:fibronectin type 3 domain-containing protein